VEKQRFLPTGLSAKKPSADYYPKAKNRMDDRSDKTTRDIFDQADAATTP